MRNRIGLARGGPGRFNEVNLFQGAVQRIIRLGLTVQFSTDG